MNEHPIMFSGDSVRAILEGRKTQTRRVMKPGHIYPGPGSGPYGGVGEFLWVRETWKISSFMEGDPIEIQYKADGATAEVNGYSDLPENEIKYEDWWERVCCQSTDELAKMNWANKNEDGIYIWDAGKSPLCWRPSMFMPRWASRINLEIVKIGWDWLQNITEEDSVAEGMTQRLAAELGLSVSESEEEFNITNARRTFQYLWDSINSKRSYSWGSNPKVWVIEFKRVQP